MTAISLTFNRFSPQAYNNLPSIESAYADLEANDFRSKHLPALWDVIDKHGVEGHVGIAILHQHYHVAENEVPVQHFGTYFNQRAMITGPVCTSSQHALSPYLIKFAQNDNAGLSADPLEYTEDKAAKVSYDCVMRKKEFLAEISTLMHQLGLEGKVGLYLYQREGLPELMVNGEAALLERTDSDRRLNISLPAFESGGANKYIETVYISPNAALAIEWKCVTRYYCEYDMSQRRHSGSGGRTHEKEIA